MKKFIIQSILLIVVIFLGTFFYVKGSSVIPAPFLPSQNTLTNLKINDYKIQVEVADTQEKRSKGLGGRETLATDSGMLFVFEREDKYPFWMKGLKFPLDFVWIKDTKVVDITENVPVIPERAYTVAPPNIDPNIPIYQSKEPIDKLLEVNAGFVAQHEIKIGDTVSIQR